MESKSSLTLADVCHPFWSAPCSDLFTLFIQNQQSSDTLVSFHLPRPLSESSESQAAFRGFSEGHFWGSELLEHPRPFAHAVPGPGVPCLTPPPSLSPNAAASGGAFLFHPVPDSLLPLYLCTGSWPGSHDHIPPGDWFLHLPPQTESSGAGLRRSHHPGPGAGEPLVPAELLHCRYGGCV